MQTNSAFVTSRARVFFTSLLVLLILLSAVLLYEASQKGLFNIASDYVDFINRSSFELKDPNLKSNKYNNQIIINTNESSTSSSNPSPLPTNSTPKKVCYKFVVPHLDGSSSNLCYTQNDYGQLQSWKSKYSTAKSFYEFNLEAADDYQDEYDRTGSSVYLSGKERALDEAQEEKQKMEAAVYQMQLIESKGF